MNFDLFDSSDELREKERVLRELANGNRRPLLDWLRQRIAERWPGEWVTADHARVIMREQQIELPCNNFLGSLFRCRPEWYTDGVRVPSCTKGSHGNPNLRWRAKV